MLPLVKRLAARLHPPMRTAWPPSARLLEGPVVVVQTLLACIVSAGATAI